MSVETQVSQIASKARSWLGIAAGLMILIALVANLAQAYGVHLPIRSIGHVELAYLAGAYWLVK